ncbi:glycosyltransferase family 2 protein [Adhaeribacter aquaticus]|uniref:glycosyltransferase family 2 protein n=1 Tax=Adhaeribacter aquaticus TaxID=299567 RepID=UPI00041DD991|nr:glycosyltransferase family 2 protein [Adhaeribacter aquaticus]
MNNIILKLSILIPVYNESATISKILENIQKVVLINGIEKEIIIINDCSTDETEQVINNHLDLNPTLNVQYYKHERNQGKGAALRTGIPKATGEFLIIQDADLEYDPQEYNRLLKPVIRGFADVVYGSRFIGACPHRTFYFWHSVGNKLITSLSNLVTNLNLTDIETCYKLFNTITLQTILLRENRFGFEPEITIKISKIPQIRIYEVGISYYGRTYEEGKKINWKDGIRAILCIIKYGILKRT